MDLNQVAAKCYTNVLPKFFLRMNLPEVKDVDDVEIAEEIHERLSLAVSRWFDDDKDWREYTEKWWDDDDDDDDNGEKYIWWMSVNCDSLKYLVDAALLLFGFAYKSSIEVLHSDSTNYVKDMTIYELVTRVRKYLCGMFYNDLAVKTRSKKRLSYAINMIMYWIKAQDWNPNIILKSRYKELTGEPLCGA